MAHFPSFKLKIKVTYSYTVIQLYRKKNTCTVQDFFLNIPRLHVKGCGMGPWLVLVSPCFRENEVATCKIGSFLWSLYNLLQKNVIVLFFGNQISKWRSFEKKRLFLTYFSYFLVTREKLRKFLKHISQTHTHTYFAHPIVFLFFVLFLFLFCFVLFCFVLFCFVFCLTNFERNTNLSGTVSLWYESWCWFLFTPFWNNQ